MKNPGSPYLQLISVFKASPRRYASVDMYPYHLADIHQAVRSLYDMAFHSLSIIGASAKRCVAMSAGTGAEAATGSDILLGGRIILNMFDALFFNRNMLMYNIQ